MQTKRKTEIVNLYIDLYIIESYHIILIALFDLLTLFLSNFGLFLMISLIFTVIIDPLMINGCKNITQDDKKDSKEIATRDDEEVDWRVAQLGAVIVQIACHDL